MIGYLHHHPGTTERARFPYHREWMIVIEDGHSSGPAGSWNYRLLLAGQIFTGWWIEDMGGGGSQDRCFTGPVLATGNSGQDKYALAMTGDPHWTIQGFVDGRWRTVPTTNGVLFEDGTVAHPASFPRRVRPVDTARHVPACYLAEHPGSG